MSIRRLLIVLPILAAVAAAGGWYWLFHAESGARWAVEFASESSDGRLSSGTVSGSLSGGVTLTDFAWSDEAVDVRVRELGLRAAVNPFAYAATLRGVKAADVAVSLRGDDGDESASDPGAVLAALPLPVDLTIEDARIENVRIEGLLEDRAAELTSISVAGRWYEDIRLDRLVLESGDLHLTAAGDLGLAAPHTVSLQATLDAPADAVVPGTPLAGSIEVEGTLDGFTLSIVAAEPAFELRGELRELLGDPHWDLVIDVPLYVTATDEGDTRVTVRDSNLQTAGTPSDWRATLRGFVETPGLAPLAVEIVGNGNAGGFAAERLDLRHAGGSITGTADLVWQDAPSARADLELESVALASWLEGWTGQQSIGGTLSFDVETERLVIRDSRLSIDNDGTPIEVDATLEVRGAAADWNGTASFGLSTPAWPSGRFDIVARGNADTIDIDELGGRLLGGSIEGTAQVGLQDGPGWQANLQLTDIHTGELLPDWPATLNGGVTAVGRQEPFSITVDLDGIHGRLHATSLAADGRIDYDGADVTAAGLTLRHGESRALLDGSLYGAGGLRFDLAVGEIGNYLDGAAGGITASGVASLNSEQPSLSLTADSDEIAYDDWRISGLSIRDRAGGGSIVDLEIVTGAVSLPGFEIDSSRTRATAGRRQQRLELDAVIGGSNAHLAISGTLDDWNVPSAWDGQLDELEFVDENLAGALAAPADLDVNDDGVSAEDLCIEGAEGLDLCADVRWGAETGFAARAEIATFPVNLINGFVDTGLRFNQVIGGSLQVRRSAAGDIDGNVRMSLSGGSIVNIERPDDPVVVTETGELSFDLVNGNLRAGMLSLPMPGLGRAEAEFEVADVSLGSDSAVAATLVLVVPDISKIDGILPNIDSARGSLDAKLDVGGTVGNPSIGGNIDLANGGLVFLPLGTRIDDIELSSDLAESGDIELNGTFRVGEGRGEIHTRAGLPSSENDGISIRVSGEDLALIDVPDIQAVADTDLGIDYGNGRLDINGEIVVSHARVQPERLVVTREYESGDVVIVAGELPPAESGQDESADVEMHGTLAVTLGDDVAVILDLASANIAGTTTFTWSGDPLPMANGRYDFSGEIRAYGQRLEIEDGAVRFANVPADNPQLRIRATREIYGNTEVKQAGIAVLGQAKSPTVEPFTVPPTTEERSLTLLLTGSDFDYEQGVGAVGFGTYIAPRLYASYGIGLFDSDNVVRLRYDLPRGFGVTATSGQRDSGFDLSYRIEN